MKKIGMYEIIMTSWGGTKKLMMDNLTYDEAIDICEGYGWTIDEGYVWDLDIEPMD